MEDNAKNTNNAKSIHCEQRADGQYKELNSEAEERSYARIC